MAPAHGHARTIRMAMLVPAYGMMTITDMAVGMLVVAGHALHRAPPWAGRVWGQAAPVVAIIMEGAGPAPAGVVARMVAVVPVVRGEVPPVAAASAPVAVHKVVVVHPGVVRPVVAMAAVRVVPVVGVAPIKAPRAAEPLWALPDWGMSAKGSARVRGLFCMGGENTQTP